MIKIVSKTKQIQITLAESFTVLRMFFGVYIVERQHYGLLIVWHVYYAIFCVFCVVEFFFFLLKWEKKKSRKE